MFRKSVRQLRKSIKQHRRVIDILRGRYFYVKDDKAKYDDYNRALHFLVEQYKLKQEELDILLKRGV